MDNKSKLSARYIKSYIEKNYGSLKHDPEKMRNAAASVADEWHCSPVDVFHFAIESRDIQPLFLTSYGFHTANGRAMMDDFARAYRAQH